MPLDVKLVENIPLDQIDLSDGTFSINFMPDLERLRSSIQEMGVIQPVLLREKPKGYQIISGFRRIGVVQGLGHAGIASRLIPEETEDLKLFFISLHDNLTSRGFNTVEKAIALEKLVDHFKVNPVVVTQEMLPLFDLERNEKILNTFLSLARMEEEVKRYVLKEAVSRSNIRKLARLSVEDRNAAITLLTALKLGENSLREILTLLEEITKRDRCSVRKVIDLPEIQALITHPELTSTQKTERVKRVFMVLRYPRMSYLEEQFEKKRRGLSLPPAISLHPPPFFEGRGLRIAFQFESVAEYRSILSSLSALAERGEFQEMMEDPSPQKEEGTDGGRLGQS
jgi:ParB/RepB/Spo0J family partition protein